MCEGFPDIGVAQAGSSLRASPRYRPISRPDFGGGERFGGGGLTLLEGLLDKSDYTATEPHGTTVRVEKKLHYETKGAADGAVERDTDTGGVVTASKD